MNKFLIRFSLFVVLFLPYISQASLEITEIMYDPKGANTNHQWIEVYNSGSSPVSVDASKWRFNDGSSHYMNSKVDFSVPAQSYFILTGDKNTFLSDHPGFGGVAIDTSMAIDKDGSAVSILNDGSTVDSVSFTSSQGGAEDGNSLQKSSGVWVADTPTPNAPFVPTSINNTSNTNNSISDTIPPASEKIVKKEPTQPKITTEILSQSVVVSGIDFNVNHKTIGLKKENIILGRFVWNFGDGMSRESNSESTPFTYRYDYPGEYLLSLSYYQNSSSSVPDAIDRMVVRVIPAGVVVSSVGTVVDPYIELENKSGFEITLSGWIIKGINNLFVIPGGTIIMPGKKIKISSRITHFTFQDLNSLSVLSPSGEVISIYPDSVTRNKNISSDSQMNINSVSKNTSNYSSSSSIKKNKNSNIINLNDMTASAGNTDNNFSWPVFGLIAVIVFALSGVYTIRFIQKQKNHDDGLEKPVNARDIDIIE